MQPQKKQTADRSQQPGTAPVKPKKTRSRQSQQQAASKPVLPAGTRRMKVQPKFVRRLGDQTIVPQIILSGHWLRAMGFEQNSYIVIQEQQGALLQGRETLSRAGERRAACRPPFSCLMESFSKPYGSGLEALSKQPESLILRQAQDDLVGVMLFKELLRSHLRL